MTPVQMRRDGQFAFNSTLSPAGSEHLLFALLHGFEGNGSWLASGLGLDLAWQNSSPTSLDPGERISPAARSSCRPAFPD